MSAYWEIAKKHFKMHWTYRSNFYMSIIGNALYFFIMINVWQALYKTNELVNGITLTQMITYTIITDLISSFAGSNIAYTIASQVKDGTIGNELAKPIDYKMLHLAQFVGSNVLRTLCVTFPTVILMSIIYDLSIPSDLLTFGCFLFSAILGMAIKYSIEFLFGILAFWLKTSEYSAFLLGACGSLFSGNVVPLWFYPEILRNIALVLPFRFMAFEPLAIYLGTYTLQEMLSILTLQLLWFITLILLERFLWQKVQKYLVIQGG